MNEIKSYLPATIGGTEITRFNALRHGVLSRYTVLPWEDAAEYGDLLASLVSMCCRGSRPAGRNCPTAR